MRRAALAGALALVGLACGDDLRPMRAGIGAGGSGGDAPSGAAGATDVSGAAGSDSTGAGGADSTGAGSGPTGAAGSGITGAAGAGPSPTPVSPAGFAAAPPCEDIFAPVLQTFAVDIAAGDWAAMHAEYVSVAMGTPEDLEAHASVRYPVVFHYGAETMPATIRLKGESSWQSSYMLDGDDGKMQFVVAFDDVDQSATFHNVNKLSFDMPPSDPTFLHDRISNNWLRAIGIPAFCATSARLMVNGDYYGLFSVEERPGHHYLREFFPDNAGGDLYKSAVDAETNASSLNLDRLHQFARAASPRELAAIVDVPRSLKTWAAEVMLNDGDGYWGGGHNFLLYDQGAPGYVFLPYDLDATLEYLHYFTDDPVFWWSTRSYVGTVAQHYQIVINDADLRAAFVEAVTTAAGVYDVALLQGWIDAWAAQIRDAVAADPHKPSMTSLGDFDDAVELARGGFAKRAAYIADWAACKRSGSGADADGDGYRFCEDCRDDNAAINPAAPEVCGNGVDDNCNGSFDEGCPAPM
jgi:hypothetical protein